MEMDELEIKPPAFLVDTICEKQGTVWATAVGASLAHSRTRTPLKPSLRLIHARMHAQALTLAVLSGAAVYHYYDKNSNHN
ncbi:hypothetical protein H5410_031538 [Solanum commersonii]|uniref:HIG1 domain-containing protein n=1 Tax=Solanum commersonii TaxID=4109 RepID=A0A9J5YKG5_SOLCO|nr:hypothetical protein H5410_031538 [Solanum commersonii]